MSEENKQNEDEKDNEGEGEDEGGQGDESNDGDNEDEPKEDNEKNDEDDGKNEDLTEAERKELEDLRKKDFNFKKMRSMAKKTKEEVKKEKDILDGEWKSFKENMINERKEDALALLVGDDEEARKKVLYNFNRIDPDKPATTKEDIFKRMREALNMTGEIKSPNILTRGGHSGFRGQSDAESPESKKMREELRIKDEDKKKYSSPDWKPKF